MGPYKKAEPYLELTSLENAPVAQGTEQGLPKPRVGGSIPPRRT